MLPGSGSAVRLWDSELESESSYNELQMALGYLSFHSGLPEHSSPSPRGWPNYLALKLSTHLNEKYFLPAIITE